jgi:hypothetical protein
VAGEDAAGQLRYRMHGLLRAYAQERLRQEEPPASQDAALGRLVDHTLALADRAAARLGLPTLGSDQQRVDRGSPAFPTRRSAIAWLESERACLVGAVLHAGHEEPARTWRLADFLGGLCAVDDAQEPPARAAHRSGDGLEIVRPMGGRSRADGAADRPRSVCAC